MKHVRHPNVVNLREVLASKTHVYIVLELVTGGELFDRIVTAGATFLFPRLRHAQRSPQRARGAGKLEERHARVYFQQLMDGVAYCHERGVCHRDLKPENLLLDAAGRLKISDFGLSSLPEHHGQARGAACGCRVARPADASGACAVAVDGVAADDVRDAQLRGAGGAARPRVRRARLLHVMCATRVLARSQLALTHARAAAATTAAARTCGPAAASCTCSPREGCLSMSHSWRRSSSSSQTQSSRRAPPCSLIAASVC